MAILGISGYIDITYIVYYSVHNVYYLMLSLQLDTMFKIALASAMKGVKMALPVSFYGEEIADNTLKGNGQPETATWAVPITTITAANYNAVNTAVQALSAAVATLILGNVLQKTITADRVITAIGPASTVQAQRENKLLLRYRGATSFKKYRVSIPTFDLSQLVMNSEFIDLTSGAGLVLKTTFEAVVKSPDDGAEAVILDSAQFVGRNS